MYEHLYEEMKILLANINKYNLMQTKDIFVNVGGVYANISL